MDTQYRAKSFKSGNSVAIRMPAALGIEPMREWTVTERDGDFVLRPVDRPKRKFNLAAVWGCAKGSNLGYVTDRSIEARPLGVDDPAPPR